MAKKTFLTAALSIMLVLTMMPLHGINAVTIHAATQSEAPGGIAVSNEPDQFVAALGSSNADAISTNTEGKTVTTITLQNDIVLADPLRITLGSIGDKVILNLNGHTITGKEGVVSETISESQGRNAIEIAADEFDVEVRGPGSIIGGKAAQFVDSGIRSGSCGGCAVFFCERVDELHGTTSYFEDIVDEGYRPDKLEYGLTLTAGAALVGGAGADVTYDDWISNIDGESGDVDFSAAAGNGGAGIGQIFTGIQAIDSLEELSYAKITIVNGTVTGGAGGNADLGDHLFTRFDIQKLDEIQQFMEGKAPNYSFDSFITDQISFTSGDGGNGIEFYAGRKYISIEKDGNVYGGNGGRTLCSERASMAKRVSTQCGDGGIGIYVCGDIGLTKTAPSLSDSPSDDSYWATKNKLSDDVGVYVAGLVKGGSSPATTLLGDNSSRGGVGILCDLDSSRHLCAAYTGATFDENRGIVFIDQGGRVYGGDSGSPEQRTIAAGDGGDAVEGGSTGSPTGKTSMTAGLFLVRGDVAGGYGSNQGGYGMTLSSEKEYLDDTLSSAYYCGSICGDGTVRGGDSGEWPDAGIFYTTDAEGNVYHDGEPVCAKGFWTRHDNHPESLTISSEIQESTGSPAHIMKTDSSFTVYAEMTPFETAPSADTKLRCRVNPPARYTGKIYTLWYSELETSSTTSASDIEGADGACNDFHLLGNQDYPYGIVKTSYGNDYKIDVATYDRMAERIKYNDSNDVKIYCHVILEDGRTADSNVIWFSKYRRSSDGWMSSGGSDNEPTAADREAAKAVADQISALSEPEGIGLYDEDTVLAIRTAYEELTDLQKTLISADVLARLEAAETKIAELNQAAADTASNTIRTLLQDLPDIPSLGGDDPADPGTIAAVKSAIEQAVAVYNGLSDHQKPLVDVTARALLDNAVSDYNSTFPDDPAAEPINPAEGEIPITSGMITVARATYTGKALMPKVTIKFGGKTLTKNTDYTVTYVNNINAGTRAIAKVTGKGNYEGTVTKLFTIDKAANPLSVKGKTAKVKHKKVKKKNQTLSRSKVLAVSKNQGKVTYKKSGGNKKITINKTTGKVTVKKKLKKGTYKIKVKVTAAGNSNYKALTRTVTFKIKVK